MSPSQSSVPDLDEVGIKKAPPEVASLLRPILADLLHRNNLHFPGAQPVSFTRKHVQALKERDYWVCEKSDGVRMLLFMTVDSEENEAHYFVDRKNDYYLVPHMGFHAPLPPQGPNDEMDWASFHRRTVLDGELLWDTYPDGHRVLKFLVFDCLTLEGEEMTGRTLDKRLAYFQDKLWAPYGKLLKTFPDDCSFIFKMEKKEFQLSYGIEMMFREIMPKLKHTCDGLIFTCRETAYKYGTDEHILKWKPAEENTIDFRMKMEFPPIESNGMAGDQESEWDRDYDAIPHIQLYVSHGQDVYQLFDQMYIEPNEWEDMKKYAIDRNDGLEEAVVECYKDSAGRWRFNRFREDKNDGNHVTVVQKVQESINDGVSKQELMAESPAIRAAWKKRNARLGL